MIDVRSGKKYSRWRYCKHELFFQMNTLMARWRNPSLSIHGIEGAFSEPGAKTVIPRRVIGKFSIRIVPNQSPESVSKVTIDYLNKQWEKRDSPNKMKVKYYHVCLSLHKCFAVNQIIGSQKFLNILWYLGVCLDFWISKRWFMGIVAVFVNIWKAHAQNLINIIVGLTCLFFYLFYFFF